MVIPTVSIGLPVYNGQKYLQRALDSLLQQDYEDFELIISDNASDDRSPEICRVYAAKDKRIRYYRNEINRGATWNFRKVFELARGKYFKWAAYDDECYPSMLYRCVETMHQAPTQVVVVYPRGEIIDDCGQVVGPTPDHVDSNAARPYQRLARVLFNASFAHSFYGLIRSESLRKTRGYVNIAPDHVLLAELAMWGQIWEIPEVLFRLRLHPENAMNVNKTRRAMQAWFNPRGANRWPILPYEIALVKEHWKSVWHARLAPIDKCLCFITVLTVPQWRTFLHITGKPREWLRSVLTLERFLCLFC